MQGLFYCVLFIVISANLAALLDQACNDNNRCDGNNLVCLNDKCRCDAPLYQPCNSTCEPNTRVSYEGDRCVEEAHCLDHMRCSSERRCVCLQDYYARNGLCYKTLNTTCTNHTQCWSGYCIDARCTCPAGYEANGDGVGCRRKFVKIYQTLNEARPTEAYCSDSSSCYDPIAQCHNESNNAPLKFCKCPQGFRVSSDNEKCELVESPHFSPLIAVPEKYEECGTCKDSNAICMVAAQERTCWCRAGYRKENDRCVNARFQPVVIFPNTYDRNKYDYTASCNTAHNVTGTISEGLCTCAPGYRFIAKDRTCQPIQLEWISDALEYGLCTHIDSSGIITSDDGLCPSPLTCQPRRDKYVCSCGPNKFRDIDDPSRCVHLIGDQAKNATDLCPTKNAERNTANGTCQCLAGFKATTNRRQCEVQLSSEAFDNATCSSNRLNDAICTSRYGERTLLCSAGQCRCHGNQSFFNENDKRCYAPLDVPLTTPYATCPPESTRQSSICRCNAGYRTMDQRTCVPHAIELVEYMGTPSGGGAAASVKNEDCTARFKGPVQLFNGSTCQCLSNAFRFPNRTGCWYRLNMTLAPGSSTLDCPPHSSSGTTNYCKCEAGFEQKDNECVPKEVGLYDYETVDATNTIGLTDADCRKIYTVTAELYPGRFYCVCKNGTFLVRRNTGCRYRIGFNDTVVKTEFRCPEHAYVKQDGDRYTCLCQQGYYPSNDSKTCETSAVTLDGTRNQSSTATSTCTKYNDVDCQAKFGANAFCYNDTCYCNRRTSYINVDRQCEPLSSFVFPGLHEFPSHTCMIDKDCGDQANVECARLNDGDRHKICRCVDGAFLDPKSGKCVTNRCEPPCNTNNNFECRGDQCVCKSGYIPNGATCVQNNVKLELNERCNASVNSIALNQTAMNNHLTCDDKCFRARCRSGYRPDDDTCVRYKLEDACAHEKDNVCGSISANAFCNRDSNRCTCGPSYYQIDEECARAVNSQCVNDEDCGGNMRCETQRCQCNADQRTDDDEDVYGRPIQRCINNGVTAVKFSFVMMLVVMIGLRSFLN